ncbi:hypothetical protein MGWOODY_Smn1356 [hydrothermal vent metagenome]|uniref:Uncharacterized protein n=1 Tax=hydrothermal vent metagenome TaxID=652676 RepID=A0A170PNM1_9ZZZZ
MGRQLETGGDERLGHFAQDVGPAFLGLVQRDAHDLFGDARDLDVHLHRGDAFGRASHLEIHVAEVILVAQDVGQDGEVLALQDQAHRDARDRALQRHAGIHHRQRAAAHRRHRRRAVRLGDVGEDADRVGELFLRRQHRVQRAPGELAMADFATARRTEAADFADRIGREVIVKHEMLVGQAGQAVDHLLRVARTERGGADRLSLAAREQRRAVRARQEVDHRLDRTDLGGGAAVDALAVLQDGAADDLGFQLLHQLAGSHLVLRGRFGECRLALGARLVEQVRTLRLVGHLVGGGDVLADQLLQLVLGSRQVGLLGHFPGLLGCLLGEIDDRADCLAACLVGKLHRAEHHVFRQLLGFGFDHHHRAVRGGDDQVEIAFLALLERRVQDVLAIDIADAGRADRAHERHAGDGEGGGGGDHREDVRLVLAVIAQHLGDDVDLVVEAFREQRADRAVDQAAGQRLLFGGAALTLEEAAGDAARSREFFLVVDGEREEILPFLDGACSGDRAQHDGFAKRRNDGAIGLAGNAARFQREGLAAPLDAYGFRIEHFISFNTGHPMRSGAYVRARPARAVWSELSLRRRSAELLLVLVSP